MLLAALFMPMTMNAQTKSYKQVNKVAKNFVKKDATPTSFLKTSLKAVRPMADVPEGYAQVTLTAGDVWQDGTGYQMLLDADATAYGTIIPETGGLNTSGDVPAETYAEFEYKIPENADGALATANIVINSSVTITIPAGTYDWCITNPTPGARMWIASENGTIGGRYNDFEFVSGVAYEFIVSLGGQNDQVDLIDSNTPSVPTDVFVTPTATTGDVAWTPGDNNNTWNLRWRPWTDPALMNRDWSDMNVDNYLDIAGEFMIYDADGDGKNWGLAYADDTNYNVCFYSASYENYASLTPDNWLITPEVPLGGTLKFKTWNSSSSFLDKIMVYVCTNPDFESLDEFVAISDFIQPGTTAEEFELDLSDYEGMGLIAFRHYDSDDMFAIYVDDIAVEVPGGVEPAEWTLVENVTNPYTIEGLTPETKYEVQVQAVSEDNRVTDWTETVEFTTLADGMNEFYLLGDFNNWGNDGGVPIKFEEVEDGVFEAKADMTQGDQFKVITYDVDGSIIWMGGTDETGVGHYDVTTELLGVPTALYVGEGSNFMLAAESAVYKVRVTEAATTGLKGLTAPLQIEVVYYAPTAIENLNTDSKVDNTYYNLQGVKFNGMPSVPGIYINGGKKVIVK